MLDITALKADMGLLLGELGVAKPGNSCKCPFHKDTVGSLQINYRDGQALWKCHAGCGGGTIIDAHKLNKNLRSNADALRSLGNILGKFKIEKEAPKDPVLNVDRAERFIADAHANLLDRLDLQEKFMRGKRGLTLEVCERYRIGFMTNFRFAEWRKWEFAAAWVLPITDGTGTLKAVKLHIEIRQFEQPKNLWAPFGTEPKRDEALGLKPRHRWLGLWPAPEQWALGSMAQPLRETMAAFTEDQEQAFLKRMWSKVDAGKFDPADYAATMAETQRTVDEMQGDSWLYLCPGELKALAHISKGQQATSPTEGEGKKLSQHQVTRLKGRKVVIEYDDDNAGRQWRDDVAAQLSAGVCKELQMFTFGTLN